MGKSLSVAASLPAGHALDGAVGEWSQRQPSVTLGGADQVAGPSPVSSARDLSARVWLAATTAGLVIAGEVTDDVVRLPTAGASTPVSALVGSDHVEVWLAFPGVPMPDLGFGSQWGWTDLPDPDACAGEEANLQESLHEACREWVTAQLERRRWLPRLFTRQFLLAPDRVEETWWSEARQHLQPSDFPAEAAACCAGALSRVRRAGRGYTFEALLPPGVWPATEQAPVSDVRLLVDLVDNDAGDSGQESFLSSSRARRFGEPETFSTAHLAAPWVVESSPPMVANLLQAADQLFVMPGTPVRRLNALTEMSVGYQSSPETDDPMLLGDSLPTAPVARWGDVAVYLAPAGWSTLGGTRGYRLLSFLGDELRGSVDFGTSCLDMAGDDVPGADGASRVPHGVRLLVEPERPSAATGERVVFFACEVTRSAFGAGMAGAASELELAAAALSPGGALRRLGDDWFDSHMGRADVGIEGAVHGSGVVLRRDEELYFEGSDAHFVACSRQTLTWEDLRAAPRALDSTELALHRGPDAALVNALQGGEWSEVEAAVAAGANVRGSDPEVYPPLALAIGRSAKGVAYLLAKGADPNVRLPDCGGDGGLTPLHLAAGLGDDGAIEALLAAGARRDTKTDGGATPLDLADPTVRVLLGGEPRPTP